MNEITLSDCFDLGLLKINCTLLSKKFVNISSPLNWFCNNCGNKFTESYINISNNNKGCLKCVYKKYNKKNCK